MNQQILHTPEGVRDIYNEECSRKLRLQQQLHDTLRRYGYRDIETPTFEFFDVFSREVGTVPSKELYKFFDREGNTLVLRPDFTPSIARAASKYFLEEDLPIRLCYMGNTFINSASYRGRLKENTQFGAELMGDASIDADAEIIALVIESLLSAGLKEFQVSVGHIAYFKSFLMEAGIQQEDELTLRELISNKNYFGVEEFVANLDLDEAVRRAFIRLPYLYGTSEVLDEAKSLAVNMTGAQAVDRLAELYEILKLYGYERYVSFDFGIVSKYKYYTGILFQAYTYGTGEPVVKGGRYDTLLEHFGKKSPAVGFAVVVDQLLSALTRQDLASEGDHTGILVVYQEEERAAALSLANELRGQGKEVELLRAVEGKGLDDYRAYAERTGAGKLLHFQNGDIAEEKL
ncbi:MAG: ATP phosphoribosyltransferase regulatory subunit [Lachnospiraceae bacterium]|nr:ATP phosphoribosyltransferase regulatory subunit [Lachnospiraceae bacterium]